MFAAETKMCPACRCPLPFARVNRLCTVRSWSSGSDFSTGRYGSISDTRLSTLPMSSLERTDTGTSVRSELRCGFSPRPISDGAKSIGDRRQRDVVERHIERAAHPRHLVKRHLGSRIAAHRRDRAHQRRRCRAQQATEDLDCSSQGTPCATH